MTNASKMPVSPSPFQDLETLFATLNYGFFNAQG